MSSITSREHFDGFCVVRRPTSLGIEYHYGVHFSDGSVAHLLLDQGVQIVSLEDFACGYKIHLVRKIERAREGDAKRRALEAIRLRRRYHLLNWNCETFANWVADGKPVSHAITAWAIIFLLCVLVLGPA